ncbi:MAG: DUF134 domain-containing protein [Candidatus Cloacimonetes bacterium]|nr:DUF134 domain-containing protein [Candidatus Cloacimonadota bacterium]
MPRPKKRRMVHAPPEFERFKPAGIMRTMLQLQKLSLEEYEAVRLADYLGMGHQEAATEMEISRPTFTRLIEKARHKVATFLIEGRELLIDGGHIHFRDNLLKCRDCGHSFRITIEREITECPACGSTNLVDFAGGYGHGRCCRGRNRNGRR